MYVELVLVAFVLEHPVYYNSRITKTNAEKQSIFSAFAMYY